MRKGLKSVLRTVLHALKQARPDAIASAELTDAEMALIDGAEIPPKQRYSLDKS
jgi:antitoxin StbD